jgi:hypothetical protein
MGKPIALISIWREEACTPTGIYTYDPSNPFDGIETYMVADEETAMIVVNDLADKHPAWKFHIEAAKNWEPVHGRG